MSVLWNILAYIIGAVATVLFFVVCISTAIYFIYRRKKASNAEKLEKSGTQPLKVIVARAKGFFGKLFEKPPSWLVALGATVGGWWSLVFAVYVLQPDVWQWLETHPALLWMTPILLATAGILYSTKKLSGQAFAILMLAVLLSSIASAWQARPERNSRKANAAAAQQTLARELARWQDCVLLPYDPKPAEARVTLYAPVGTESPCYLIRNGYAARMMPQELTTRVRWQNGTVWDLSPDVPGVKHLGSSIRYAAFTLASLGDRPAPFVVRFEKK